MQRGAIRRFHRGHTLGTAAPAKTWEVTAGRVGFVRRERRRVGDPLYTLTTSAARTVNVGRAPLAAGKRGGAVAKPGSCGVWMVGDGEGGMRWELRR